MLVLDNLTPAQRQAWDTYLDGLRALEESARETDDPWLFHGTSAINAAWIEREGFKPSLIRVYPEGAAIDPENPPPSEGVHWGTVNVAQWAAERASRYSDDPPVILAARLSDLRAAGDLMPDYQALEEGCSHGGSGRPYDNWDCADEGQSATYDWKRSLAVSGCVAVTGAAHIRKTLHHPLRSVEVSPNWERDRANRMRGSMFLQRRPPRGMPEATPRSHPPTLTSDQQVAWAMAERMSYAERRPARMASACGEQPEIAP